MLYTIQEHWDGGSGMPKVYRDLESIPDGIRQAVETQQQNSPVSTFWVTGAYSEYLVTID